MRFICWIIVLASSRLSIRYSSHLLRFFLLPARDETEEFAILKAVRFFKEIWCGHKPYVIPEIAALGVEEAENDGHREIIDDIMSFHGCRECFAGVVAESAFHLKIHDLRHAFLFHDNVYAFVVGDGYVACKRCFSVKGYQFRDSRFRNVAFLFFRDTFGDFEDTIFFYLFSDDCGRFLE